VPTDLEAALLRPFAVGDGRVENRRKTVDNLELYVMQMPDRSDNSRYSVAIVGN